MADGTKKPISEVRVGDLVVATDAQTGKRLTESLTREDAATQTAKTYDYDADAKRLGIKAKLPAATDSSARFRPYAEDAQGSVIAVEPHRADGAGSAPKPEDRYQLDPFGQTANESKALDAYRRGRLFHDPRSGGFVRHSSRTGISVVTDAPSTGRAITVFEGKPSPDWNPVRWRAG